MKLLFSKSQQEGSAPAPLFQYAQRRALFAPSRFLIAAAVMISLASVPLVTEAHDRNEHDQNAKRTLTGNWMVTVTRINPAPGQAPTFLSLVTYFEDGNLLQEGNDTGIRGTGRSGYQANSVGQNFDTSGNLLTTSQATEVGQRL